MTHPPPKRSPMTLDGVPFAYENASYTKAGGRFTCAITGLVDRELFERVNRAHQADEPVEFRVGDFVGAVRIVGLRTQLLPFTFDVTILSVRALPVFDKLPANEYR
jgi:hypothetical protein